MTSQNHSTSNGSEAGKRIAVLERIALTNHSGDPAQVSIDVVNATANEQYVLVNNVRGANVTDGNYTLHWASAIPSANASYTLVFLDYSTGGYVAQSPVFILTLPSGETRNTSIGNSPASPGTSSTAQSSSSGLSSGDLAAAIVVPIVVVLLIVAAAIFFWRRRRRALTSTQSHDGPGKSEMEGTGIATKSEKHQSAELSAKNHMSWELPPRTPPREPVDPQELPAEVPLAEMQADEGNEKSKHVSGFSENDTTVAGSTSGDKTDTGISPLISQDGFRRDSISQSIVGGPQSPLSSNGHRPESTAPTTTGRSRFGEAIYDLVSDELRRPDA